MDKHRVIEESTSTVRPYYGPMHVRTLKSIKKGRRYRIVHKYHPNSVVRVVEEPHGGNVNQNPMILVRVLKGRLKGEITSFYLEEYGVVPYGFPLGVASPPQWNKLNRMMQVWI